MDSCTNSGLTPAGPNHRGKGHLEITSASRVSRSPAEGRSLRADSRSPWGRENVRTSRPKILLACGLARRLSVPAEMR